MDRRGFFSLIGLGALYYKSHNEWGIDNRYPQKLAGNSDELFKAADKLKIHPWTT